MSSAWSLEGKTVLITGAARGIGADSARRLAKRGARISLVGLEPDLLADTAAQCGSDSIWFEADVTDAKTLDAAVAGTVERLGGIDVVVANAGTGALGSVRTVDPAAFERTIEINMLGTWRTVRACLEQVIERQGYVLTIASIAAIAALPGSAAYAASKAGIEHFADTLRLEVAHLGVDVGVGYFAFIDTNLVAAGETHPTFVTLRESLPGPLRKTYPLSLAGEAVVRGIERRRRRVVAPRWVHGMLAARGLAVRLGERAARPAVAEAMRQADAEVERRGAAAASIPEGAAAEPFKARRGA